MEQFHLAIVFLYLQKSICHYVLFIFLKCTKINKVSYSQVPTVSYSASHAVDLITDKCSAMCMNGNVNFIVKS